MSAWITDRVPTIKDADRYGGVMVTISGQVLQWDWAEVKTGTPWQPITYPEPYVKEPVWSWKENEDGTFFVVCEHGVSEFEIDRYSLTISQIQAMTDALNKLEETP